jgi:hypothetical protein
MHEHFGQRDEAETCFEYIFAASVYHPYALFHGNAFFEKSGKAERATEMGKRLASIRSDAILAEACEYDSGVDDDL